MMTKNQKIALGCGGGGCLGLVLLVIVCVVLVVSGVVPAPGLYSPTRNYNYNSNSNSNSNSNTNDNLNSNSDSSSSSSMSDDDKHKLFQAAGLTKDTALMQKVLRKFGFLTASGSATSDYEQFMKGHFAWAMKNVQFIQSVSTPETARAYVDAHIDD
jgi:fructose-1,6-bisphosphatase/inositol monophosphatase family enzyme